MAGAVKPYLPNDAPAWYVAAGFGVYFAICTLFNRYLEKHELFLKLVNDDACGNRTASIHQSSSWSSRSPSSRMCSASLTSFRRVALERLGQGALRNLAQDRERLQRTRQFLDQDLGQLQTHARRRLGRAIDVVAHHP